MTTTIRLSRDGAELAELLASVARPGLIGVCGAPGVGKSTFSEALGLPVVPMDGFHLADVELERRGLLDSKGAPDTFDAWGYANLLDRISARPDHLVMAPSFERTLEQPLAGALPVNPDAELIVTEGNYLLLDRPEWRAVRQMLQQVWHLRIDDEVRRERLVARHVEFGKSESAARDWVDRVDEPNCRLVELASQRADVVLDLGDWVPPGQ